MDGDGRLEVVSDEGLRVLGRPGDPSVWVGRAAGELLAEEPELLGLLGEALAGRDHPPRAELSLAGSGRTIGFTLLPLRDGGGAALLFKDLTPFERASEQERLAERLAALGQMAAGLAHEIRNPLAAMEVIGGLLKRRLDDPESQELVQEMLDEQRRIGAAVDACLAFVRPEGIERAPVDLAELVRDAAARATRRAPYRGTLRLPEASGPRALVDELQLRRALVDLIVNAIQAMEEAGTEAPCLELSVGSTRGGAVLVVADNGPGVPAELRDRIFAPFFTTRSRGSGVGLAQAQKTAAAHGGTLQLESAPGEGATFRMHLPAELA